MSISERLEVLLKENGLYDINDEIQEKLLSEMDSLQFIQLVVAIENEFHIGVPDEYLLLQYFRDKQKITEIIEEAISRDLKSIQEVVEKELCIGCLACIQMCPHGELEICNEKYPFPTPVVPEYCDQCGICLLACPAKANNDN